MRIVIDLQACQAANKNRGIGRYSLDLAKAMIEFHSTHNFWILTNGQLTEGKNAIRSAFHDLLPLERIVMFDVPTPAAESIARNHWRTLAAEKVREFAIAQLKPDILHIPSLFEGFIDDAVTSINADSASYPTTVTVHDLIPLAWPEVYLQDVRMRQWYERKLTSLKQSSALLAVSEHSRKEAISRLDFPQEQVFNTSSAVDERFKVISVPKDKAQSIRSRYGICKPFVMYTGGIDYRKNIEKLIAAYADLPVNTRCAHQLLIVCSIQPHDRERLNSLAQKQGLGNGDVQFTNYVSDEDLIILYNLCRLFVFPSLDEGFGLPVLEAMSCGAAVIGSNVSSVPEVIGRKDALFDPLSTESIARAIHHALTDSDFRANLREHATRQCQLFSWQKSAERVIEALEMTHERHLSREAPQIHLSKLKPRLAFISPLPPLQSGISDYSVELIPELATLYDIVAITNQPEIAVDGFDLGASIEGIEWFQENAHSFDRIVYQFGNSAFHCHMFDLLRQYPGAVVLHDFYLSSIAHWMAVGGLTPDSFAKMLYSSHGYPALIELKKKGIENSIWTYPCNKSVLDQATGIIVHSNHAKELAQRYFGEKVSDEWLIVPQLYTIPVNASRDDARLALGFGENDFVVCSFGSLGPTKLNHRLLDAWLASDIAADRRFHLIFVGQSNGSDAYQKDLIYKIRKFRCQARIKITGFLGIKEYRCYLAAADTVVQLRTLSRGETSRAILETLSYGIPLIANDHGSIKDYPEDILIHLPDDFSDGELINAIVKCRDDAGFRNELRCRGLEYVTREHSPGRAASLYYDAIEKIFASSSYVQYKSLLSALSKIDTRAKPDEADLIRVAKSIVDNSRSLSVCQLLVDISELVQKDVKTGIQRVVRSVLINMLYNVQVSCRIEPVYFDGKDYRYARRFTTGMLETYTKEFADDIVDVTPQDIFLGLDLSLESFPQRYEKLSFFVQKGVKIHFVVYDTLLLEHPEWWPPGAQNLLKSWIELVASVSDSLVCISNTVVDSVENWIIQHSLKHRKQLAIKYFHLGADIEESLPTNGVPQEASRVLESLAAGITFLMVGTIEPRKGYSQTLKAFELLWSRGLKVNLVIVGKTGWMVDSLILSIESHPQLNRHLFWLKDISDEYLKKIYSAATVLLVASEGEGFGLPLIEAAQHKLPIIARDIPIFREVASHYAFYFEGTQPEQLANAIEVWTDLYSENKAPSSAEMPWLTWKESTQQLLDAILPQVYPADSQE